MTLLLTKGDFSQLYDTANEIDKTFLKVELLEKGGRLYRVLPDAVKLIYYRTCKINGKNIVNLYDWYDNFVDSLE